MHPPGAGADEPAVLRRIQDFVLNSPSAAIPDPVLWRAAMLLLDTLGIAAGAVPLDAARLVRDAACLLHAPGDPSVSARLMFDGRTASLPGAAFAAATQIDNLDGHDGYNPTKGHIGVLAVPVLLALAEHRPDLSGHDALAALVVGYEVAGRAGIALHATVSDYHTSGAWNALGAVAMAGRLRQMRSDSLREAFGIAEYHGPRSQMMREIANPTMLHDGSGWGALVGLSAALMAEQGFTGAPAITLEAPEVAPHWADLGAFWQVAHQYIKPYPICRWAHAALDAVSALRAERHLSADQVLQIEVNTFNEAACLFAGMPDTTSKAQYSLAFAVATMLVHGRIGAEHISGAGLSDAAVAAVLPRITIREHARHSDRFPEGRWADVTVTTTDGARYASGDVNARGGPEDPMSDAEIEQKFESFATPVLGASRTHAIRDAVRGLVDESSRFNDLAELLYAPPGA